jgi:hypothetical protein
MCPQQNTSSRTPGIISDKTRLCWISFLFFTSATSHWVEWEATPKSRELHGMIRSLYGWPPGYVYVIYVYVCIYIYYRYIIYIHICNIYI